MTTLDSPGPQVAPERVSKAETASASAKPRDAATQNAPKASPDPLSPTDRYRLVMPFIDRI